MNSGQVRAHEKLYQLKALQDIDRIDEVRNFSLLNFFSMHIVDASSICTWPASCRDIRKSPFLIVHAIVGKVDT